MHTIITSEVELILGLPAEQSDGVTGDRGQMARDLLATWEKVKRKYVGAFFDGEDNWEGCSREQVEAKRRDKASAWYAVAYGTSSAPIGSDQISEKQVVKEDVKEDAKGGVNKGEKLREKQSQTGLVRDNGSVFRDRQFLAFGWLMASILEEIPLQVHGPSAHPQPSFLLYFGQQLVRHWHQHSESLACIIKKKMMLFEKLKSAVDPRSLALFGSVAQFLCDEDSDIDVYIALTNEQASHPLCSEFSKSETACVDPTHGTFKSIETGDCTVESTQIKSDYNKITEMMSVMALGSGKIEGERDEEGEKEGERIDIVRYDCPPDTSAHSNERSVLESLYLNSVIAPLVEKVAETKIDALPSTTVPVLRYSVVCSLCCI